jgi:glycosyltransferase involved in cell wall biosynthesis
LENKFLVSIIIPVYNSGKFIKDTIFSALGQSWESKEIIIIDDGSTDNSFSIAKEFESDGVRIFSQENKGASAARNVAFKVSRGEYIQYLDADDILSKDKIKNQMLRLVKADFNSIASSSYCVFHEDIKKCRNVSDFGNRDFKDTMEWLLAAARDEVMFPPLVWLTPRKLIEEAGPWDETLTYNDDSEFFARILLKAKKIIYCDNSISYYRIGNSSSLGSRKDRIARNSELLSLNLVSSLMLEREDSSRVHNACAFKYRKFIYSLYPDHKDLISMAEDKLKCLSAKGDYNFGNGTTHKIGKLIGWKNAKLIQLGYKKISDLF